MMAPRSQIGKQGRRNYREEVGSKNLARISHHLPHLVSLSFSLSPLRWNLLPSGWGGMASPPRARKWRFSIITVG